MTQHGVMRNLAARMGRRSAEVCGRVPGHPKGPKGDVEKCWIVANSEGSPLDSRGCPLFYNKRSI